MLSLYWVVGGGEVYVRHAGDDSELPSEGSLPNNGRMNGFVPGSSAPAAFNAASFAAHMTRAMRAASAAAGSAGASPKAGAVAPQVFAHGSAKRCAKTSLTCCYCAFLCTADQNAPSTAAQLYGPLLRIGGAYQLSTWLCMQESCQ